MATPQLIQLQRRRPEADRRPKRIRLPADDPPRPDWMKVRMHMGTEFQDVSQLMRGLSLHTICEEAHCPNIYECWDQRTATFLILGRVCTRACRFCAVETGVPDDVDSDEPERLAEAVATLRLRHAVVTSVARDDLPDGGAHIFARTIRAIRRQAPDCAIEVLVPDFQGDEAAIRTVAAARPDVFNHNVETVERLQRRVRAKAFYARSLWVLQRAKELDGGVTTKSGMMLGVGERAAEVVQTMRDLRAVGCDVLTIGQYLRPMATKLPVERYVAPEEFAQYREEGLALGFKHVESGPLVRSSYHARRHVEQVRTAPTTAQE